MLHRRADRMSVISDSRDPYMGSELKDRASVSAIQGFRDVSSDTRNGLNSLFAYGKRSAERSAYQQAHTTASGIPGVVNLVVANPEGKPIPFAPFEWNGRQMYTDAKGMIKYVEKDYFQSSISMENERIKYVTQMIALVAGQPSENVIALFGYDFWNALASDKDQEAVALFTSYLNQTGLAKRIQEAKIRLFIRYADGECSPEVMCNYGDNDPEWAKAFNKLAMMLEFHPSAILFDHGTLNPLESQGVIHGDKGRSNVGPMGPIAQNAADARRNDATWDTDFQDSNAGMPGNRQMLPRPGDLQAAAQAAAQLAQQQQQAGGQP